MLINETDFKAELPIASNFNFDKLSADLRRAELNYIKPILGVDLHSILDGAYADDTLTDEQEALMAYVKPALAHLGMWLYVPKGNVYVGDQGLQSAFSNDSKPAFEWQKQDFENSMRDNGFDALDELIAYLESVANVDFADWLTSEGCTLVRSNIVNTAKAYTEQIPKLRGSRYLFAYLRPIMSRIERDKLPAVIGKDLYNELKAEIAADDVSELNAALLPYLEAAVCHASWASALIELSLQVDGEGVHVLNSTFAGTTRGKQPADFQRLQLMRDEHNAIADQNLKSLYDYLVTNVADYPLFESGGTYDAEDTDPQFENDADSGVVALF